ncbi:hypothetical protein [Actinoplanes auranticolor]|uniref:Uncharacterized protein n=1 Tax=Actinoplanes auranticolor TaxID=47988 RepID=A0A919SHM1_9ACTN|nr:hypothetical protein [Actinoplanes auranticolor]GIM72121.1 hypothetical protein Aau02nite_49310 [Actinoplanes auranticolor]
MYRTPSPAYDRTCDCGCPTHHGQPRSTYNHPGCHCLTTCATQPMTLLDPQISGALFLDRDDVLWYVPGLEPGHWDWRNAVPVNAGHPLRDTSDLITGLLRETHARLRSFAHDL